METLKTLKSSNQSHLAFQNHPITVYSVNYFSGEIDTDVF